MDPIQTAIDDALPSSKFQIFSGILKASRSDDGRMRLHGVASSTTKDLHGDTMEATALEDMERAANQNLTIFLNHSYNVPEDVAGSVESARMATRGADHVGNPNYDLDFSIVVNDANPRAVKAFEAIEKGTKLGLSIGALIPDGGAIREKKSGSYTIQHVELLETSLVGIPANPRSWVEYAAKSLRANEKEAIDVTAFGDTTNSYLVQSVEAPEEGVSPEVADSSPEPDVTDAQVTIIQIDTGDGDSLSDPVPVDASQGGPETDPDDDLVTSGDDAAEVQASAEPLGEVLSLLRTTTGELVSAKGEIADLRVQLSALASERDTANEERDRVLRDTREILDRVASAPLVRRAVAEDAQHALQTRFAGYLSDDLLKMLER